MCVLHLMNPEQMMKIEMFNLSKWRLVCNLNAIYSHYLWCIKTKDVLLEYDGYIIHVSTLKIFLADDSSKFIFNLYKRPIIIVTENMSNP